jgi:hypothetical protein
VTGARDLRVRMRRARRGHHDRETGDFLTNLYILGWFGAMYGYVLVHAARQYIHPSTGTAGSTAERAWIGAAAALALAGFIWQGLRAVGPLVTSPAAQAWALSTPIPRRDWLLPGFGWLVVGGACGATLLALAGAGLSTDPDFGWAAVAGAAFGVAGTGFGVVAQGAPPRRRWPRLPGSVLLAGAAIGVAVVVAAHFGGVQIMLPPASVTRAVAVVGLPLALVGALVAYRRLSLLDRAALTGGAQLATAAMTAAIWLDPSMLSGVVDARRWRRIGRVHGRRFRPGGRRWLLVQAELRRLVRRPGALVAWGGLVLAQYAVAVAVPSIAGVTHLIGAYLAADRLAGGLRTVCRSPGLRRALGGSESQLRLAHLVVPALGTVLWWLATRPAGGGPLHMSGLESVLVVGVIAAVYRAATRPPMAYGGTAFETPFGLIPVDLIRQITRGPDILAVLIIVQSLVS